MLEDNDVLHLKSGGFAIYNTEGELTEVEVRSCCVQAAAYAEYAGHALAHSNITVPSSGCQAKMRAAWPVKSARMQSTHVHGSSASLSAVLHALMDIDQLHTRPEELVCSTRAHAVPVRMGQVYTEVH